MPFDSQSSSKNLDNFNGAPAQPAQSFNISEQKINQPQEKKGFGFIKKRKEQNNNLCVRNNFPTQLKWLIVLQLRGITNTENNFSQSVCNRVQKGFPI